MTDRPPDYIPAGPLDESPAGGFQPREVRAEALAALLDGVLIGAYDQRVIDWLCGLDDSTVRTVGSLLWRARLAGRAEALAEDETLGYTLAIRYPDGVIRLDPLGSVFVDPAQAVLQQDAAQGHSAARGWDEQWIAAKLTEIPETGPGEDEEHG